MNKPLIIAAFIILLMSVTCSAQTFQIDSTQAKKSIQIKAERDSLRIVVKYFEIEDAMQDTVIEKQAKKIVEKDLHIRLITDLLSDFKQRVSDLEKQPKEIIQESKYSFLEIAGYTGIIAVLSFITGVLINFSK